jgi:hypothetical protein
MEESTDVRCARMERALALARRLEVAELSL